MKLLKPLRNLYSFKFSRRLNTCTTMHYNPHSSANKLQCLLMNLGPTKTSSKQERRLRCCCMEGKDDDSLNTLRYVKYLRQLSTSTTAVDPRRLPPTASAFKFHSMRIYFQVQVWSKLNESVDLVPKTVFAGTNRLGLEKTKDLLLPVHGCCCCS